MHQQLLRGRGDRNHEQSRLKVHPIAKAGHARGVFTADRKQRSRLRRGQSLVEVTVGAILLLVLVSGMFDFGRAYFIFVMLNNAVSEGSRWAAAYSACLPYAIDQTAGDGAVPNCVGSNSIVERIINEDHTLDPSNFLDVCWSTIDSSNNANNYQENTNNNTLTLQVKYNITFITPLISAMFGTAFSVTVSVQEVIRGTGAPPYFPASTLMYEPAVGTSC